MVAAIIYAIGGIIEALIGLRFLFRLLGANPNSDFVELIYNWSTPLVQPFAGIFGQNAELVAGPDIVATSVFDWTALIALLVYALIIGLITRVFMVRR
jgi:YggT family protein